jgi:hypothetical protein
MINKKAFIGQQELGKVLYNVFNKSGPLSKMVRPAAEKLLTSPSKSISDTIRGGIKYFADFKTPEHLMDVKNLKQVSPEIAKQFETKRPVVGVLPSKEKYKGVSYLTGGIARSVGNQAANFDSILYGGYGFKGKSPLMRLPEYFKRDVNFRRYDVSAASIDGARAVSKKSLAGQIYSPLAGSGIAMGGLSMAAHTRNKDGTPATLLQRVPTGISETLKWGIATPIMTAKILAYDAPKFGYNILKQKKNLNKE